MYWSLCKNLCNDIYKKQKLTWHVMVCKFLNEIRLLFSGIKTIFNEYGFIFLVQFNPHTINCSDTTILMMGILLTQEQVVSVMFGIRNMLKQNENHYPADLMLKTIIIQSHYRSWNLLKLCTLIQVFSVVLADYMSAQVHVHYSYVRNYVTALNYITFCLVER